jgi:hypothetical protein
MEKRGRGECGDKETRICCVYVLLIPPLFCKPVIFLLTDVKRLSY